MLRISCFLVCAFFSTVCFADDPIYINSINHLFSLSDEQTFILDTWQISGPVWNTAMTNFIFDSRYGPSGKSSDNEKKNSLDDVPVVISWCQRFCVFNFNASSHRIRYAPINSTSSPNSRYSTSGNKDFENLVPCSNLQYKEGDQIHDVNSPDLRLFLFRNEMRYHRVATFGDGDHGGNRYGLLLGKMSWNDQSKILFATKEYEKRLLIDREQGKHAEKNWSPFQFDYMIVSEKEREREKEKETSLKEKRLKNRDENESSNEGVVNSTDSEQHERKTQLRGYVRHTQERVENRGNLSVVPLHLRDQDRFVNYSHPNHVSRTHSIQLFVYSIEPHRVVYGRELSDNYPDYPSETLKSAEEALFYSEKDHLQAESKNPDAPLERIDKLSNFPVLDMTSVAVSKYVPSETRPHFWSYGNPHGSTPSILIHTKYGPRYLNFFHSEGRYQINYIVTYFFGAYLFDAKPPFAITHMTADPLVPRPWYNESNGWAYRAIDYIIFPMGLVIRDDLAILSSGRNDRSGWMATFNVTELIDYMIPIQTEVLKNSLDDVLKAEFSAVHSFE